jgi:molybdopterin synthase catalytic subunit
MASSTDYVSLIEGHLDPWTEIQRFQETMSSETGKFGATACFVGTMRDFNEGETVTAMFLEHYPGMTERYLQRIRHEALQRWEILDALIVHRIGKILPNEPIVLTAVWSAHRVAAFEACRFLMEELKSRAPLWKRETLEHGSRWVGQNTPGY